MNNAQSKPRIVQSVQIKINCKKMENASNNAQINSTILGLEDASVSAISKTSLCGLQLCIM